MTPRCIAACAASDVTETTSPRPHWGYPACASVANFFLLGGPAAELTAYAVKMALTRWVARAQLGREGSAFPPAGPEIPRRAAGLRRRERPPLGSALRSRGLSWVRARRPGRGRRGCSEGRSGLGEPWLERVFVP